MTKPPLAKSAVYGRAYVHPVTGEEVPSVTSVISAGIPKPALIGWAAKSAAEYAAAHWDDLTHLPDAEKVRRIKGTHRQIAGEASGLGDEIHGLVDAWNKGEPTGEWPHESQEAMFTDFLITCRPRILESEATVWSRTYDYAGTFDFVAEIGGIVYLADLKCLTRDVLVTMADGTEKRAEDIHHGDQVAAWDEELKCLAPASVLASGDNGVQPTWHIETKCGRVLTVTCDHPVLTRNGWVKAADLKCGDAVRTGSADFVAEGSYDADTAYYLGLIVGDGCVGSNRAAPITNKDPEVIRFLDDFGARFGLTRTTYGITHNLVSRDRKLSRNPLVALVESAGLLGCVAKTKFVPQEIMGGGKIAWRHFLAGYLDTDGHVRGERQGGPRANGVMVSWSSRSERLLRQCQSMLAGLGVRSSVYQVCTSYKREPYFFWQLAVRDRTAIRRLQHLMPSRGGRTRKLIASDVPPRAKSDTQTGVLEWDKVIVSESGEVLSTVWMEVAGYHTHVTGGIVSHNTGKGLWPEMGLQVSALSHADFVIRPDGTEEPMPPVMGHALLHLRPDGWRFVRVGNAAECFAAFLNCRAILRWQVETASHVVREELYGNTPEGA